MNSGIQLVTELYAAFAAGDLPSLLERFDPEVVWNEAEGNSLADGNPYIGPEAIVQGVFIRLMTQWSDFRVEVQEILGSDEVVTMLGRYRGTSIATGQNLDVQAQHTWWLRDSRVVRFQQMVDTKGLAAAEGAG